MGIFGNVGNFIGKVKNTGSKILNTARDINAKFGDYITAGASGLMKIPHPVAKAIGGGVLAIQKILGKSDQQLKDEISNKVKEKIGIRPMIGQPAIK